ncbi:hypothetical protein YSY43_43360 [Paenibacillus sp. YSY-4.3]
MKRLLYGIVMLCFMDLFIQLPVMGPFAKSLGAGSFVIGLAVGLYSLTNMFGNIAAGSSGIGALTADYNIALRIASGIYTAGGLSGCADEICGAKGKREKIGLSRLIRIS